MQINMSHGDLDAIRDAAVDLGACVTHLQATRPHIADELASIRASLVALYARLLEARA